MTSNLSPFYQQFVEYSLECSPSSWYEWEVICALTGLAAEVKQLSEVVKMDYPTRKAVLIECADVLFYTQLLADLIGDPLSFPMIEDDYTLDPTPIGILCYRYIHKASRRAEMESEIKDQLHIISGINRAIMEDYGSTLSELENINYEKRYLNDSYLTQL